MKECCDVLYHNYVDLASIYRILPQNRPIRIRPGSTKFTGYPAGSGSGYGSGAQLGCG